jgi:hypothetical protein
VIGALAHVVPIALNIGFYSLITSSGIGNAAFLGLAFHCVFSALEVVVGLMLVSIPAQSKAARL